jgi:hypothetical protein
MIKQLFFAAALLAPYLARARGCLGLRKTEVRSGLVWRLLKSWGYYEWFAPEAEAFKNQNKPQPAKPIFAISTRAHNSPVRFVLKNVMCDEIVRTKIFAGIPSFRDAYATAAP